MDTITIVAFAGSLRQKSYNRSLLKVVQELMPPEVTLDVVDLLPVPLYNGDVEAKDGIPPAVEEIRQKILHAHGVLIVSPEYNYSIPGVLKNAIDWISRPPINVFEGKPFAIMGASDGYFGTVRSQMHLRFVLEGRGACVLPKPEVFVPMAQNKFDADGKLTDEETRQRVKALVDTFVAWLKKG